MITLTRHLTKSHLCNISTIFQRCIMSIFSDIVEKHIEVFMDDFSVFEILLMTVWNIYPWY